VLSRLLELMVMREIGRQGTGRLRS
jgi:hypothetical protein